MTMRTALAAATVALTMAATTACGAPAGPTVATAQRPAAAASGTPSTPAKESDYDQAVRYTRCMTDNGEKIPDPVEGKPLQLGASGKGWTTTSAAFATCRHFLPTTWPVKADPNEIARHRPWGDCMHKHGVDVPEMNPDANGLVHSPPDPTLYYTPQWQTAEAACRYLDDPGTIPLTDQ